MEGTVLYLSLSKLITVSQYGVTTMRSNVEILIVVLIFRIVGCTHINAQTAVLVETLVALGAQVTDIHRFCTRLKVFGHITDSSFHPSIEKYGFGAVAVFAVFSRKSILFLLLNLYHPYLHACSTVAFIPLIYGCCV